MMKKTSPATLAAAFVLLLAVICLNSPAQAKPKPPFTLPLDARDITYSPLTDRIYACTTSVAAGMPNSVATIVLTKKKRSRVESSLALAGQPRFLALSDDGRYLYVALDGAVVNRIDLARFRLDMTFSAIPAGRYLPLAINDLRVVPGHPESVAVSVYQPGADAVAVIAVYDNGVQRPATLFVKASSYVLDRRARPSGLQLY